MFWVQHKVHKDIVLVVYATAIDNRNTIFLTHDEATNDEWDWLTCGDFIPISEAKYRKILAENKMRTWFD